MKHRHSFFRVVLLCLIASLASPAHAQGDAQQFFIDGFEALKAGKATEAVARFEAGLKADPSNAMAHYYLGEAYLAAKQQDKAKASFEKSVELEPFGAMAKKAQARLAAMGGGDGASAAEPAAQPRADEPAPGSRWTEPKSGIEFAWVPSGCFVMGSGDGDEDERPPHKVCVKGFYMARFEVTQAQYQALTGKNPSKFRGPSLPVETVSWNEVKSFADEVAYRSGTNIRLPSEAEWEYACRGGGQTDLCGRGSVENLAWYEGNSGEKTHPVGQLRANVWGLHDMSGNVWEWVEDCYHSSYDGAPVDGSARISGCSSSQRVMRGGGWYDAAAFARSANRGRREPTGRDNDLGFRLARTLP